jgi:hypothetical protein
VRGENPDSNVLSLPTEGQCAVHPLFAALKYSAMRMSEMLSSEVAPNVQDQLGRFGNWKLTDGFSHEALQILTDEGKMNEAEQLVLEYMEVSTPHTYWLARSFVLLSDVYKAMGKNLDARQYLLSLKQNYQADDDIAGMIESRLEELKD